MSLYRLAQGQVVEMWANMDTLGLLRQLGALPSPE
jgi:predicted ester cyclase